MVMAYGDRVLINHLSLSEWVEHPAGLHASSDDPTRGRRVRHLVAH